MKHLAIGGLALFLVAAGAGCQPPGVSAQDVEELKQQQQQILTELKEIREDNKKLLASAPPRRPQRPPEDYNKVYRIEPGTAAIKGSAEALVAIVEYSDFQCPFCARVQPQIKALLEKYPDDVKLVFKHFPLSFHKAARPAALATMAAQEQGKFWELHDVLFENQRSLDAAKLEEYAQKAGLDLEKFKKDLEANRQAYDRRVSADLQQGSSVDVRGTPSLYIGGKKVRVRTIEGMSAMVEAALKEAKKG